MSALITIYDLNWLMFLIGPLYLIGKWFGEGQRANIVKDICLKEVGTTSSNINNYSTLNSEDNWKDLCTQLKNSTNLHFPRLCLICFIVELLVQHEFCCVKPIGRS